MWGIYCEKRKVFLKRNGRFTRKGENKKRKFKYKESAEKWIENARKGSLIVKKLPDATSAPQNEQKTVAECQVRISDQRLKTYIQFNFKLIRESASWYKLTVKTTHPSGGPAIIWGVGVIRKNQRTVFAESDEKALLSATKIIRDALPPDSKNQSITWKEKET